jgi:hypothetical protein
MTQRSPAGAPGICRLSCAVGQSISGWLESPGRPYDVLGSLPWPEFTCRQFEFKLPNSVGSIGWNSSNGGLEAVDSSIEEDLNHSIVVTTTIRAATAIVIRIMAAPLFGRDCAWCVKGSVEVIGCSPVADMRTQIERAALRRYFSLGEKGCDCKKNPCAALPVLPRGLKRNSLATTLGRPLAPGICGLSFTRQSHGLASGLVQ